MFAIKLASDGTKAWSLQIGSPQIDEALAVAIDDDDNIVIAGFSTGAFDGNNASPGDDAILIKYDSAGNKLFSRQFGVQQNQRANAITVDSDGAIYVGGTTQVGFDGQAGLGGVDSFVKKYTADGDAVWTVLFGGNGNDNLTGLVIDANGNLYAVGTTNGEFGGETNAGALDPFVIKLAAADGAIEWTRIFGTAGIDISNGVEVDSAGDVYVGGWVSGAIDDEVAIGGHDGFVVKYAPDGTRVWTQLFGTPVDESVNGLCFDANDILYLTGTTTGDFGGMNAGKTDLFAMTLCEP